MGNVQVIVDADTARAYENFQKLVDQQARMWAAAKKTAGAMGEIGQAANKAGASGEKAGMSMGNALKGVLDMGPAAVGAIAALGNAWGKVTEEARKYRQQALDIAMLEDVKNAPKIQALVKNQSLAPGVGEEFKFRLIAGLQKELGAAGAQEAFKVAAPSGLVFSADKAQEFGELFGKMQKLAPQMSGGDVLDASFSIMQRMRGDLGKFDFKSVEQLVAAGIPMRQAVGAAMSFGQSEQGSKVLQSMVDLSGQDKEFAAPKFGTALTDKEKAERAFFGMGHGERLRSLMQGQNLELLGGGAAEARVGLADAAKMSDLFRSDVLDDRAGQQILTMASDPAMQEYFKDALARDAAERYRRDNPYLEKLSPDDYEFAVNRDLMGGDEVDEFRKGVGALRFNVDPTDAQRDAAMKALDEPMPGTAAAKELSDSLERNTSATRENTGGGFNGGVE